MNPPKVIAIVPAAGYGKRMGSRQKKPFTLLGGTPGSQGPSADPLVLANGNIIGFVNEYVCRLKDRISQKTKVGQVLARQVFLLFLIGRYAFEPAQRRHHAQQ